jgi:hypothetical protein
MDFPISGLEVAFSYITNRLWTAAGQFPITHSVREPRSVSSKSSRISHASTIYAFNALHSRPDVDDGRQLCRDLCLGRDRVQVAPFAFGLIQLEQTGDFNRLIVIRGPKPPLLQGLKDIALEDRMRRNRLDILDGAVSVNR